MSTEASSGEGSGEKVLILIPICNKGGRWSEAWDVGKMHYTLQDLKALNGSSVILEHIQQLSNIVAGILKAANTIHEPICAMGRHYARFWTHSPSAD
jgi:hypothetical protein